MSWRRRGKGEKGKRGTSSDGKIKGRSGEGGMVGEGGSEWALNNARKGNR